MMRIHHCLLLYCILTALVVSQAKGQPAGTANFDPRPLNSDDVEQYLPQVCQGAQVAASGYSCQAMKGYPGGEATPSAGTVYNFVPTTIIYGHLTDAISTQAYVSYTADFEPHADNYGGGILFQLGSNGWQFVRWVPGIILDKCLQLEPSGKAQMLCWFGYSGMGEDDTSLSLVTVPTQTSPNNDYGASLRQVIAGQDLSQTGDANQACGQVKGQDQYVLTAIDDLARSTEPGVLATAKFEYVEPSAITKFCAKQDFADAPVNTATIRIIWLNGLLEFKPSYNFAPPV